MKKFSIALGIVIIGSIGWYLASPLFIDSVVEEEFPLEKPEEILLGERMSDTEMAEAMPNMNEEPRVLAQGSFQGTDNFHKGSGKAIVYEVPGDTPLLRFEDFSVTNGPALSVYLSKHPAPQSSSDLGTDVLDVGKLKGNIGNQNYTLPEDSDLAQYNSVVIYCVPFKVVFATAALQK